MYVCVVCMNLYIPVEISMGICVYEVGPELEQKSLRRMLAGFPTGSFVACIYIYIKLRIICPGNGAASGVLGPPASIFKSIPDRQTCPQASLIWLIL